MADPHLSSGPGHLPGFPVVELNIKSNGMWPTLRAGKPVWITFTAHDHLYQAGQIVIFETPFEDSGHRDSHQYWIQRIVAMAGDTIAVQANQVLVNGVALVEPYVMEASSVEVAPTQIPPGHVWLQGDNRPSSFDSRLFGALSTNFIVGLVSRHRPDDWMTVS